MPSAPCPHTNTTTVQIGTLILTSCTNCGATIAASQNR